VVTVAAQSWWWDQGREMVDELQRGEHQHGAPIAPGLGQPADHVLLLDLPESFEGERRQARPRPSGKIRNTDLLLPREMDRRLHQNTPSARPASTAVKRTAKLDLQRKLHALMRTRRPRLGAELPVNKVHKEYKR
jgi:hypothetical protein